ncbi:hypothetical protein GAO09_24725 [Rhizobiales bacterium RZME27]|uniref:Uncharacterized protein n=1 Tax=Endobacterium cereale TaxID=2663029 RepID=A0A6A8AJ35_9HYPH|nr:hypothetical protein [Endobacterium cereale]MEB2847396.1 hypothetical protein [Endobacterium cereale]MQY49246.1 hypothetical protein [Endobacterium cereale]
MNRQVIEHAGVPVGIAVQQDDAYRFIAVKFHVIDLDEHRFNSLVDLRAAIRDHVAQNRSVLAA